MSYESYEMKLGVRWDPTSKCFTWSQETENQDKADNKTTEANTMIQFSRMASSLISCLEFTMDCPGNHGNGRMPVLDTSMWVELQSRELGIPSQILPPGTQIPARNGKLKRVVMYRFYRKEIASKTSFNMRSAGPVKDKVQQTSQEYLRRFRNTSRQLPDHHIEEVMSEIHKDLKRGGFTSQFIANSLRSATTGYMRMVKADLDVVQETER